MSTMTSALNIGRSALLSYQSALQVVGANISGAGNPEYTRQTAHLTSMAGAELAQGLQPGAGVALTDLRRNFDETLENRLRLALGDAKSALTEEELLSGVEALFDDAGGAGLSTSLLEFFNHLAEVQNNPTDVGIRDIAVGSGVALADRMQGIRSELSSLVDSFVERTTSLIEQADELAGRIASLNADITAAEAGGKGQSNALRDQRDGLLRQLGEILDVQVRVQPDGSMNVYVGSEPLVQNGISRGLVAEESLDGDTRSITVRFADTRSQITPRGGHLFALLNVGRGQTEVWKDQLDQLAVALISEVNRVHANGQGLNGFSVLTGATLVADSSLALNDPRHEFATSPVNGSFYITTTDEATGTASSYQIAVDLDGIDSDDTLQTVVDRINATAVGVSASITVDGRLALQADPGAAFVFGQDGDTPRSDTSGVLAALGLNTFFTGSSAADIAVNSTLQQDSGYLAASSSGLAGDGNNAGTLSLVAETASSLLRGADPTTFYNAVANEVAVRTAAARGDAEASETVLSSLQAQKEAISGVNLDEEAIEMVKFERAFQGAARYVAVVDRTLQELMSIL